jgi:hypothetical protein
MKWYGLPLKNLIDGGTLFDWNTDTIKCAVVTSAYTPNQDTDDFWNDVSANEASASGYTAGGATLASCTVTYDTTNNRVVLDAADVTWTSAVTGRYLVVYKDTGTASTSPLLGYYDNTTDFGGGSTLTVTWDSTGVLRIGIS